MAGTSKVPFSQSQALTDPKSAMPSAKSIVAAVYDGYKESFPEKFVGKIGRLYQARCYLAPHHRINGARRQLMRGGRSVFVFQGKMLLEYFLE